MWQLCPELLGDICSGGEQHSFLLNSSPELKEVKGNKLALSLTFEEWMCVAGSLKDIHNE